MTIDLNRKLARPPGHHTITPAFMVGNVIKVIDFLQQAFGGEVTERWDGPNGTVMHAEVRIGDSVVMLGSPDPANGAMPAALTLYVDTGEAVDLTYKRALTAGAKSESEPTNQFYGYRSATVRDAGGNRWTICAVIEALSHEEIKQRMAAFKP